MTLLHLPLGPAAAPLPTHRWPLHSAAASRALEQAAQAALPPHTLMQRAAVALARWVRALYPHARHIWVLAGPGNNGGDGLLAAALWHQWAHSERLLDIRITVTWTGSEDHLPPDAAYALAMARQAGVTFQREAPEHFDVAVDALLGLGSRTDIPADLAPWLSLLRHTAQPVLQVDLPSGLSPDTGNWFGQSRLPAGQADQPPGPRHTLSLLTLKPGLFTGLGRDLAGDIWWDDLDVAASAQHLPTAWLQTRHLDAAGSAMRAHASHKGSHGDVLVLGGQGLLAGGDQPGSAMVGAALLAGRAALHAGAGRVFVGLLDNGAQALDPQQPELMFRSVARWLADPAASFGAAGSAVVCGCGGGTAVDAALPQVLAHSTVLVLDADALNAVARRTELQEMLTSRGKPRGSHPAWHLTVLTPHPLEAARLLGWSTEDVQADRLAAAQALADRYHAVVVLKGSGSVVAAPGMLPVLNGTGNARLATGGTGDVLAGLLGARLAALAASAWASADRAESPESWIHPVLQATAAAVAEHGLHADDWPAGQTLTAGALGGSLGGTLEGALGEALGETWAEGPVSQSPSGPPAAG
jgi:ADP-dependent NAD(P)H-hydrate dehydratase / NAD(P)H-hydrate epimerase